MSKLDIYSVIGFPIGLFFPILQFIFGIYAYNQGVNYYAEAHLSPWNSYIHTFFMPFTSLGFLLAIPAVFSLPYQETKLLQNNLFFFYLGLYLPIDYRVSLLYLIVYYPIVVMARLGYKNNNNRLVSLAQGLILSTSSLIIQEVMGHMVGGDIPSRPEGVFNAVLYAKYFSLSHFLEH